MSYLIDTDIIIYSIKGNEVVHKNFLKYQNYPKSISIVTYGELLFGAKKSQNVDKNLAVVYRIKELFPVIGIDKPIIETFSGIKLSLRKEGNPIDDMDLLIASTALTLNLSLSISIKNWICMGK